MSGTASEILRNAVVESFSLIRALIVETVPVLSCKASAWSTLIALRTSFAVSMDSNEHTSLNRESGEWEGVGVDNAVAEEGLTSRVS